MHVLIPFEVAPVSERAVRTALEFLTGNEDVHVTAIHVSDREETPAQLAASEIESMGENYGVAVEASIELVERSPESKATVRKAITDLVEAKDFDLVVVGYEDKSVFSRVFRSDTTERLLKMHDIPVLLVP